MDVIVDMIVNVDFVELPAELVGKFLPVRVLLLLSVFEEEFKLDAESKLCGLVHCGRVLNVGDSGNGAEVPTATSRLAKAS